MSPSRNSPLLEESPPAEWLLLIHQLPADPAYLRVKVARRLRRLGALQLKSSVYVLPASDETAEDFRWLIREITAGGGEATLARTSFLEGKDDEVKAMFQRERDAEYDEIATAARGLEAAEPRAEEVQRLRRRLDEAVGRDFFDAPGRAAAEHVVGAAERRLRGGHESRPQRSGGLDAPRGAVWVTRRHVKVDRLASAWLIRRFLDPQARFLFVDPASYRHSPGELRFDMYEGEYGHEGERCTFETLLACFGLENDAALRRLGEVVHDLDCKESRFGHPEGAGVAAMVQGIAAAHERDEDRLQVGLLLFEALYRSFHAGG